MKKYVRPPASIPVGFCSLLLSKCSRIKVLPGPNDLSIFTAEKNDEFISEFVPVNFLTQELNLEYGLRRRNDPNPHVVKSMVRKHLFETGGECSTTFWTLEFGGQTEGGTIGELPYDVVSQEGQPLRGILERKVKRQHQDAVRIDPTEKEKFEQYETR
jgi:hypothetical protein